MKGDVVVVFVCLCVFVKQGFGAKKLPDYVTACKRNDPNLSQCWENSLRKIQPHLKEGILEFSIPSIEPLLIEKLTLSEGNSSTVSFEAVLMQLKFNGSGDFKVSDTHLNLQGDKFINLKLYFPRLIMTGSYKAKGRVLLFRFDSVGQVKGDYEGVHLNGTWYLKTVMKKGKEHLMIERQEMDVKSDKLYFYLGDLFKNNQQLTETVNRAINENIDAIYDDIKPVLSTTIGTVFTEYSNRVYNAFPYDVLYPTE